VTHAQESCTSDSAVFLQRCALYKSTYLLTVLTYTEQSCDLFGASFWYQILV